MNQQSSKTRARLAGASALAICLALSSQASAQDAASSVEEVVITGSRVARTGFVAPTPTTVVSTTLIQTNAGSTIGAVLNNLPAFKSDYSPAASGPRTFDSPGAVFANLRSLGSNRTLTLLDNRRLTPSSPGGQADLNLVPSVLIETVDVVTGGASAAYGSDAVAGVVNVRLKKKLQGVLGTASYGQTSSNDMKDYFAALALGTSFADGKGHFMVGGEYDDNKGTGDAYTRDWGVEEWGIMPNPTTGPGASSNLLVKGRHTVQAAIGGLVQSGPLKGLVFMPNGATRQYQYGSPVGPSFQAGGEGAGLAYQSLLMNPLKRKNILARLDWEFSPALAVYLEGAFAKSNSLSRGNSPQDTAPALTIQSTNPYLPAAVRTLMQQANVTTIPVGRNNTDLGINVTDVRTKVQRYVFGADGRFGGNWRWDAFVQYGKTNYINNINNTRIQARWQQAVQAVTVTAANVGTSGLPIGSIQCASTLTAPTNGCIPTSIFGDGAVNAQSRAWFMGNQTFDLDYTQWVGAANIRGEPFSTWAGPVAVAAGVEHRNEKVNAVSDPISQTGGWQVGNQRPINGAIKVTEGYLEALTPLLKDYPIAKLMEVNTAVRLTDYSTSGKVTTWKVGVNWELNDWMRLRGTRSRDIRAANMTELFAQGVSAQNPITNPATNVTAGTAILTVGNRNLQPERANTTTLGSVVRPPVIPGLELSVDRYNIDLKGAIAALTGQQYVDFCFQGRQDLCAQVTRTAANVITQVTVQRVNIASIKVAGWDFEARYRAELAPIFGGRDAGQITWQFLGTRTDDIIVNDLITTVDYAGDVGSSARGAYGQPKWRWTMLATWDKGPFSTTATLRHVGGGNLNNTWTVAQIANNRVPGRHYFDMAASYNLSIRGQRNVQIFANVQNVFDKAPPVVPTQVSQTNPVIYDVYGRQYRAGVRFSF